MVVPRAGGDAVRVVRDRVPRAAVRFATIAVITSLINLDCMPGS